MKSVLDGVVIHAYIAVVTRRDAKDAVVMSLDYYNSLMETVHLLKHPTNAAHLAESIEHTGQTMWSNETRWTTFSAPQGRLDRTTTHRFVIRYRRHG